MKATERGRFLDKLKLHEHDDLARKLGQRERRSLPHAWELHAHAGQLAPPGNWQTWLILAGRGFGKTRAGAE